VEKQIEDDPEIVLIFGRLPNDTFPALHRGYHRIRDAFRDFREGKTRGMLVPRDNDPNRFVKEEEFKTPKDLLIHHLGNALLPMKFALETSRTSLRYYLSDEEIKKMILWFEEVNATREQL